ncbi:MAG: sigma-70 family RNA polymerase sigma factor, partial [Cyclobacteriaceae bacterium]|nr:sigma-70 family RNA polymerase sigma factor [Cyclobacteriaceae bacterium]
TQLVSSYINGNEEAFAELLNRHKARVYTTIYLVTKDRVVSQDIMQEVFMKVVSHIKEGKYNEEGKFLPWVLRISQNLAIDHFRKKKRYPEVTFEDGSPLFENLEFSDNPFEKAQIQKDTHAALRAMIKELPDAQKQVIIMRHFIGMSFQEIADRTGVSINTALGRMRYGILNLRKQMDKQNITYDKNFYPE